MESGIFVNVFFNKCIVVGCDVLLWRFARSDIHVMSKGLLMNLGDTHLDRILLPRAYDMSWRYPSPSILTDCPLPRSWTLILNITSDLGILGNWKAEGIKG